MLFVMIAISENCPDMAVNPDKFFLKKHKKYNQESGCVFIEL